VRLQGQLRTQGVALAQLPGVGRWMGGQLGASTRLSAQAPTLAKLFDALQTSSEVDVTGAVVRGMDVARAARTAGVSRGGETRLDKLSAGVSTQGMGPALVLDVARLQARSGVLQASGQVQVGAVIGSASPAGNRGARSLHGKLSVDLPGGLIGLPLQIAGTTQAPELSVPRGALLGAAIGTLIMPGAGTVGGAKLGDKIGQGLKGLFGQ
jgi:hypothetical protein